MATIVVLGSSAVFPLPRTTTNRFEDYSDTDHYQESHSLHTDPLCASARQGGHDRRTRASLALVIGEKVILFDAGPDVLSQLKREKVTPSAVFITHDHSDATDGVRFVPNAKIFSEKNKSLKPGQEIKLFGATILPFRVAHAKNTTTLGFLVTCPGQKGTRFIYMSDISSLQGTRECVSAADIIFTDGSILEHSLGGHMSIVQQMRTYKRWGAKKVYFTHIGHATLPHEELRRFVAERLSGSDVAYDGQRLEV